MLPMVSLIESSRQSTAIAGGSRVEVPMVSLLESPRHLAQIAVIGPSYSRVGRNDDAITKVGRRDKDDPMLRQVEAQEAFKSPRVLQVRSTLHAVHSSNYLVEAINKDLDRGDGDVLCSSLRHHPKIVVEEKEAYHENRMHAFDGLLRQVPNLHLMDVAAFPRTMMTRRSRGQPLHDLVFEEEEEMKDDIICPPAVFTTTLLELEREKDVKAAGVPTGMTAAFLSLERKTGRIAHVPPVGHYRPKHDVTECTVRGGYIHQEVVAAVTKRVAETVEKRCVSPDELQDVVERRKPAIPSTTAAFKSIVPQCPVPRAQLAGADEWYWPRPNPAAQRTSDVLLSKALFRRQESRSTSFPEGYSVPAGAPVRCPVSIKNMSRREPHLAHVSDVPCYQVQKADKLTRREVQPVKFQLYSPRQPLHTSKKPPGATVTYPINDKSVHRNTTAVLVEFDRCTTRSSRPPAAVNDLSYDPSDVLTTHRNRAATLQNDVGHQTLFCGQTSAGIVQGYVPNLNSTRPQVVRDVQFARNRPRAAAKVSHNDLLYDVPSPLVTQTPMLHSCLSREKWTSNMSPHRNVLDKVYEVSPFEAAKLGGKKCTVNFEKYITKERAFSGRNIPSEHFKRSNPTAPGPGAYNV